METGAKYREQLLREYVCPTRIVLAEGDIENAALLTSTPADQIGLNEQKYTMVRGICRLVLDFGQELCGGLRIVTGFGSDGAKVRLRLGESVSECLSEPGEKGCTNNHALRDLTVPLPILSDQTFFESGFRFACIDLLDENAELRLKAINAVESIVDHHRVGSFRCSDDLINRIYETAARTVQLCARKYIWDGIKRDRLVWMGDLYPEISSLLTLCEDDGCVTRSLDFVQAETPLPGWMNAFPMYSMWWIVILEEYYRLTGNAEYVQKQRPYYEQLIRNIDGCIAENGDFDFGMNFVDWPTHEQADEPEGVRSLCKMCAQSSQNLELFYGIHSGYPAAILEKLSKKGAEVVDKKQIVALKYLSGTQLSERERALLREGGAKGFSTFMSYFLLTALSETQGDAEALSALREYYGGMLKMGATTFWEDFDVEWMHEPVCPIDRLRRPEEKDIHGDFGRYCYTGFRHSLCHGWSAGVIPYLIKRVLGVHIEKAGYREITITPHLGDLEYAEAEIPTPHGVLRVTCRKEAEKTVCNVAAPSEIKVHIIEGK